jgi:hypothetical protein
MRDDEDPERPLLARHAEAFDSLASRLHCERCQGWGLVHVYPDAPYAERGARLCPACGGTGRKPSEEP